MSLRDHLQSIYDARGKLTPELVVDEAREPSHPLHSRFEWDDSVAAEKWRHEQAHELITSVKVTFKNAEGKPQGIRQFHAVRSGTGHVYEPLDTIVEDEMMMKVLMADMEREWRQMKSRYDHLVEFRRMIRRDMGEAA